MDAPRPDTHSAASLLVIRDLCSFKRAEKLEEGSLYSSHMRCTLPFALRQLQRYSALGVGKLPFYGLSNHMQAFAGAAKHTSRVSQA